MPYLEANATALNVFEFISTNENEGRESEAPAELFQAAGLESIACERSVMAQESSAEASHSRNPQASVQTEFFEQ